MSPLLQIILLPLAFAWGPPAFARLRGWARGRSEEAAPEARARLEARWHALSRLVAGAPLVVALWALLRLAPEVLAGRPYALQLPWIPEAGLTLALRLDGLCLLAAALALVVALLATLHARAARDDGAHLAMTSAALLTALGDDLLTALAGAEVLVLLGVGLLARQVHRGALEGEEAAELRRGTRVLFVMQLAGGAALAAAGLLLEARTGTLRMSAWGPHAATIAADPVGPLILGLAIAGGLAKAGIFPFLLGLRALRHLPAPSASLLTAGTLLPAGLLLLARFAPAVSESPLWFWALGAPGLLTLFVSAYQATRQDDMHGMLVYGALAHAGLVAVLLALDAWTLAMALAFAFGLARATQFVVADVAAAAGGSRALSAIGGLRRTRPLLFLGATLSALQLGGLPPFFTFLCTYAALGEVFAIPQLSGSPSLVPGVLTVALGWGFAWTFRLAFHPFFGKADAPPPGFDPASAPPTPTLAGLALALPLLAAAVPGLFPEILAPLFAALAAAGPAVTPEVPPGLLAFPGPGQPLAYAVGALVGGTIWFAASRRLIADHARLFPTFSALDGWERGVRGLSRLAGGLVRPLGRGGVATTGAWILVVVTGLVGWAFLVPGPEEALGAWWLPSRAAAPWRPLWVVGLGLAAAGLFTRGGLALTTLGVALLAFALGAADVAVFTLGAVLLAALVTAGSSHPGPGHDLDRAASVAAPETSSAPMRHPLQTSLRGAVALGLGAGVAVLVWIALRHAGAEPVAAQTLLEAGPPALGEGQNLVTTVRLDVLAVVAVLGGAGLAAVGLAGRRQVARGAAGGQRRAPEGEGASAPSPGPGSVAGRAGRAFASWRLLAGALLVGLVLRSVDVPGGGVGAALLAGSLAWLGARSGWLATRGELLVAAGVAVLCLALIGGLVAADAVAGMVSWSPSVLSPPGLSTAIGLDAGLLLVAVGAGAAIGSRPDVEDGRSDAAAAPPEEAPWSF